MIRLDQVIHTGCCLQCTLDAKQFARLARGHVATLLGAAEVTAYLNAERAADDWCATHAARCTYELTRRAEGDL